MRPQTAIVVTTISDGSFLNSYAENAHKYGRLADTEFFVIPDRKTPRALWERVHGLRSRGVSASVPDLTAQQDFLTSIGLNPMLFPENSDHRRNIGYLMAYAKGADYIISIDDDNLPNPEVDYVGDHLAALMIRQERREVQSTDKWFNPCDLLELRPNAPVYARGFPYFARTRQREYQERVAHEVTVMINAGLWLEAPDVDAITWLAIRPRAIGWNHRSLVLAQCTWAPINTQNVALHRDLIPAYYFPTMGYTIGGIAIDRFADILSGYFVQACAKALGGAVRFGNPVVLHLRNQHSYFLDLERELQAIRLLEELLPELTEVNWQARGAAEFALELADWLCDTVEMQRGALWTQETRGYFHRLGYLIRAWVRACRVLDGSGVSW